LNKSNNRSISIAKVTGEDFVKHPQGYMDHLVSDDNVGRLTISAFEGVFYLMTQDKFQFFIDYELKKQENQLSKNLGLEPAPQQQQQKPENNNLGNSPKPANYKMMLELKKQLKFFPFFSDHEFLSIFNDVIVSKYKKGANIYYKKDPENELFYVFRGEVAISNADASMLILTAGEFFGELQFMGGGGKGTNAKTFSSMTVVISFILKNNLNSKNELETVLKLHKHLIESLNDKMTKILKLNR
jgi:hypothetical protein